MLRIFWRVCSISSSTSGASRYLSVFVTIAGKNCYGVFLLRCCGLVASFVCVVIIAMRMVVLVRYFLAFLSQFFAFHKKKLKKVPRYISGDYKKWKNDLLNISYNPLYIYIYIFLQPKKIIFFHAKTEFFMFQSILRILNLKYSYFWGKGEPAYT